MPCFHPIPARQDRAGGEVVLHPPLGTDNLRLPCGTCVGCRQQRAAQWATRAVHEAAFHEHNSFVTLTYAPEHLPSNGGLRPRDLVSFIKALRHAIKRKRFASLVGDAVRYLACGEYGDAGDRPHYHALLFGVGFSDAVPCGKDLWTSECLRTLWGLGHVSFGSVTGGSAAYVAQYSLKKASRANWSKCDPRTGEVLHPPFLRCSLRPGIGADFIARYRGDTRHGFIVRDGRKVAVPRYYQKLLELTDVGLHEEFRENAQLLGAQFAVPTARLADAERIELARLALENVRGKSDL